MKIRKLDKKEFPSALLELPNPPKQLFVMGEIPSEEMIFLSVVGSRKYTSYGKEACEKIIKGLKGYPIVIVSGFAVGIDTIAHKTAIKAGLKTLVFPGSGLNPDVIYPKTNVRFIKEVLDAGGGFISEFDPDLKPAPWTFPMRNRLMAGISKAVLIIEAQEKSGTLITARLALEYNRDVLVIPGPIFSQTSKGTNKLIHQGATPVTSAEDVLQALGFEVENSTLRQSSITDGLSADEHRVIELLFEPKPRDELIREMKLDTSSANALLSIMEIKGLIKEDLGEIHLS